jgi:hypothetical protein
LYAAGITGAPDTTYEAPNDASGVVYLVPQTFDVGRVSVTAGGNASSLVIDHGTFRFTVAVPGGYELWQAVGNSAQRLAAAVPGSSSNLTPVDGSLYFVTNNTSSSPALWRTQTSQTGKVTFEFVTSLPGRVMQTQAVNDRLYLVVDRTPSIANDGAELWVSLANADGSQGAYFLRNFSGGITALAAADAPS